MIKYVTDILRLVSQSSPQILLLPMEQKVEVLNPPHESCVSIPCAFHVEGWQGGKGNVAVYTMMLDYSKLKGNYGCMCVTNFVVR